MSDTTAGPEYELRVTNGPDEQGDYWARVWLDGVCIRSFYNGDRQQAIEAAERFVAWHRDRDVGEQIIRLPEYPSRPAPAELLIVVTLETDDGEPELLGTWAGDDEGGVLYRQPGASYTNSAPHDCVQVLTVQVPR